MLFPSLEEVKRLSLEYSVIPVCWEIPADHWSPLQIYAALSKNEENAFLLESISVPECFAAWSYIGSRPHLGVHVQDETYNISVFENHFPAENESASAFVQDLMQKKKSPVLQGMPEFTGGFAGFFANENPLSGSFYLYDEIIAYNHLRSTAVLVINLHSGADLAAQYQAAEIRAAEIASVIERFRLQPQYRDDAPPITAERELNSLLVKNAPDSLELYRRIRSRFPAPCLFCIKSEGKTVMGSAQRIQEGIVQAGFYGYHGIRKGCTPDLYVQYTKDSARVCCSCQKDEEIVLELMRSAKFENTSMG